MDDGPARKLAFGCGDVRRKQLAYVATIPLDVVGWPLHILALIGLSGGVV